MGVAGEICARKLLYQLSYRLAARGTRTPDLHIRGVNRNTPARNAVEDIPRRRTSRAEFLDAGTADSEVDLESRVLDLDAGGRPCALDTWCLIRDRSGER